MKRIRIAIILLGLGLALFRFYGWVQGVERIKANGTTVLLQLAPVDPRGFMTGDYMALGYDQISLPPRNTKALQGLAVLALDEHAVGRFVRLDEGEDLQPGELRMRYAKTRGWFSYGGGRYYFQEGTAERYESAEYGVFKVDANGNGVLIALAREDYSLITPNP